MLRARQRTSIIINTHASHTPLQFSAPNCWLTRTKMHCDVTHSQSVRVITLHTENNWLVFGRIENWTGRLCRKASKFVLVTSSTKNRDSKVKTPNFINMSIISVLFRSQIDSLKYNNSDEWRAKHHRPTATLMTSRSHRFHRSYSL